MASLLKQNGRHSLVETSAERSTPVRLCPGPCGWLCKQDIIGPREVALWGGSEALKIIDDNTEWKTPNLRARSRDDSEKRGKGRQERVHGEMHLVLVLKDKEQSVGEEVDPFDSNGNSVYGCS